MLTMKGCRMEARMDFSLLTCSTCLKRITSEIVIILRAKNCLVGMSRASTTRPNVPVPVSGGVWVEGVWSGGCVGWRVVGVWVEGAWDGGCMGWRVVGVWSGGCVGWRVCGWRVCEMESTWMESVWDGGSVGWRVCGVEGLCENLCAGRERVHRRVCVEGMCVEGMCVEGVCVEGVCVEGVCVEGVSAGKVWWR